MTDATGKHPGEDTAPGLRYGLDRHKLRSRFDAAARHYDEVAVLQRTVAGRLDERLELFDLQPARVLDAGSGTGFGTALLKKRYRASHLYALDLAHGMLRQARHRRLRLFSRESHVCADMGALPFPPASFDLVFCSLALQWCSELDGVLAALRQVLRPRGLLLFATLGPDTLKELRASFAAVDDHVHVHAFMDMHDVGDALVRAGLSSPVMDVEHLSLQYSSLPALLKDLKTLGATNAAAGRARGLMSPRRLRALEAAYEAHRSGDTLPATYEVVYGHAFAPERDTRPQDGSTVARFPLSQLRRRDP